MGLGLRVERIKRVFGKNASNAERVGWRVVTDYRAAESVKTKAQCFIELLGLEICTDTLCAAKEAIPGLNKLGMRPLF